MPGYSLVRIACLLALLFLLLPARAQQPAVDPAEISRDLLYHPARRIEPGPQRITFRAAQFSYRFDSATGQWEVVREKNDLPAGLAARSRSYKSARLGVEFTCKGASTDDEATLEIRRSDQPEFVARLRLWNRQQLANAWLAVLRQDTPSLTAEALAKDLEVADPELADLTDDGTHLWLAVSHYAGEGSLGLGAVVRFNPKANEAKAFQPPDLATSSVTHVLAFDGALWLGTLRRGEGAISATKGLVRLDPATGEVRSYFPGADPLLGSVVTALAAAGNTLFAATDAGICRIERPGSADPTWTCWRIVPTVRLAQPAPVSNRPGAPSGGRLAAGSYEVRWANAAYLEVVTPDWIEGWLAADDLADAERRRFDADAYELGNGSSSGIAPVRLLAKPGSDPLAGAVVYRTPVERMGAATPEGWQRVRARVGWISRVGLAVAPVIQPAALKPAQGRFSPQLATPTTFLASSGCSGACASGNSPSSSQPHPVN